MFIMPQPLTCHTSHHEWCKWYPKIEVHRMCYCEMSLSELWHSPRQPEGWLLLPYWGRERLNMPVISTDHSVPYQTRNLKSEVGQPDVSYLANHKRTWTNTRISVDNPKWRQQIRRGENATTQYSRRTYDIYNRPTFAFATFSDPKKSVSGNPVNYYVNQWDLGILPEEPLGFSSSQADYQARLQFLQKYRSRRTAFQSGVFLGELMETVRMIRSPAEALRNGISHYYLDVNKRIRRLGHRQRVIRDTWLEYVYGWAPLISDIKSACKLATADPYAVYKPITGLGGVAWKTDPTDVPKSIDGIGGPLSWVSRHWNMNEVGVRYTGAIGAHNEPPPFSEQFGLSWSNFLPTIWELIPYSFLVDYFTNIGKVIDGISTGTIWLAWSCRTTRKMSTSMKEILFDPKVVTTSYGSSKWSGVVTGSGRTGHYENFFRDSVEGVSVGLSDVRFKLPDSSTKWLNIAALAKLRHLTRDASKAI